MHTYYINDIFVPKKDARERIRYNIDEELRSPRLVQRISLIVGKIKGRCKGGSMEPQLSQQEKNELKRLFRDTFGGERGIHILDDPKNAEMTVEEADLFLDRMVKWSSRLARKRKLALIWDSMVRHRGGN